MVYKCVFVYMGRINFFSRDLDRALADSLIKIGSLENDIKSAVDQLVEMESQMKRSEVSSRDAAFLRQELEVANNKINQEKQIAEES